MELSLQQIQNHLHTTLQKFFGFQAFRKGQEEAITTLLTKGRVLCILPTGHGKSLLYQLSACLFGGVTIVISPLLALMRDQIDHLNNRFNIPAMAINSDQSDEENYLARQAASQGGIKILFVAPEQLDHVDRFNFLLGLDVRLVVVDEAHCISTWGHDFRPSYRQILQFLHALHEKNSSIKILGLTATANKRVEADIKKQLCLFGQEVHVLRETMDRPNIQLSVIKAKGIPAKLAVCEELLNGIEGCGLIYCATRENTELVADYLKERGLPVTAYHAGFAVEEKRRLQIEFVADKYKALAATNALGMGIDKGNLRFIIHFDVPGSITAYYQEVGRCGRDGQKAKGVILYDSADQRIQEYFIHSALPTESDFQKVLQAVSTAVQPPNLTTIKQITGLHPTRVTIVLAELIEQGFLEKYSVDGRQLYKTLPKTASLDLSRYIVQQRVKSDDLKQILQYGEQTHACRMSILRTSLGDEQAKGCGHCDVCLQRYGEAVISGDKLAEISTWVNARPLSIAPMIREKVSAGMSVLDSKIRSSLFIRFMKQRANCPEGTLGMDDELLDLLKKHLTVLAQQNKIVGIVPIPSRTWQARDKVAEYLAKHLKVPVISQLLVWKELPPNRQGELLNNDQRHQNVHQRMQANPQMHLPQGALLLLDDYIGSGNTLREAARALRAVKAISNPLVPFTIAAVKWHLGKSGYS